MDRPGHSWHSYPFLCFYSLLLIIESVDANGGTLILKNTQGFPGSSVVKNQFSSVQSFSRVQLFVTPWTAHARSPCLLSTPKLTQTHVH